MHPLPSPGLADFTIMIKCALESGHSHSEYSEEISKNQRENRMVVGGGGGGGNPPFPIPVYSRLLIRIFIDDESGLSDICFMDFIGGVTKLEAFEWCFVTKLYPPPNRHLFVENQNNFFIFGNISALSGIKHLHLTNGRTLARSICY